MMFAQIKVASLEKQLEQKPEMADSLVPQIERLIINDISENGVGSRFVIREVIAQEGAKPSAITMSALPYLKGVVEYGFDFPSDVIIQGSYRRPMFGSGSVHRFNGTINFRTGPYTQIFGQGGKTHRLTFAVIEGVGYVHIRGNGNILRDDSTKVDLYYEYDKDGNPASQYRVRNK
jgi:hypothetical protein